ncbi:MAG: YkgJ family cysteine cluster protein [Bariatricus sp.]
MKRQVDMNEISDGKLYGSNDMVKADCGDCEGCSACCRGMGASIILDPLDVNRLACGLQMTFEELLSENVELNVVDGLILPNLKMVEEKCGFLNEEGRCSIHPIRPGICRLFPLGRYYENGGFMYFLQVNECRKENRSKVKVKKWIDTPDLKSYEAFVNDWHNFLLALENYIAGNPEEQKAVSMYILQHFYLSPYEEDRDFYTQFAERLARGYEELGLE